MTRRVVLIAELLGDAEADFIVLAQEAHKIVALDEVHLTGIERFGGQFVRLAAHSRAQPEDLAGFGNFEDEHLSIARTDREFHSSFAQQENPARSLSFNKEHRTFWIGG